MSFSFVSFFRRFKKKQFPSTPTRDPSSNTDPSTPTRDPTDPSAVSQENAASATPQGHSSYAHEGPSEVSLECSICFDLVELNDLIELTQCAHIFCQPCARAHCEASFSEGNASVPCLAAGCPSVLAHHELSRLLGEERFQQLNRRTVDQAIALDATLYRCPGADCLFVCSWAGPEEGAPRMDCPLCSRSSCLLCKQSPFHEGHACGAASPSEPASPSPSSSALQDPTGQEACSQLLSAIPNIRICRRCQNGVVKEVGCHKLKCRCGYRFCWECGSENAQCACTPASHGFIDNVTGYGDFTDLRSVTSPT